MSEFCEEYQFHGVDVYHLIVDMAEESIWILNTDDRIVFANPKLLSMLGYEKKEVLCHHVIDLFADEDRGAVRKALERRHRGIRETYAVRIKRKDGRLLWVAVAAAPIIDKDGTYAGVVSLGSDITTLKESETALKKEKALANLYLDLMAHDLNNLNQVSIGNLEIAIDTLEIEKPGCRDVLVFLKKSMESMGRQTALIGNVKTLQRLKTEHLWHEPVDLGEIIADAVRDYPRVPEKEVTIEYKQPQGCMVVANPLLKEVFTNLIGNSAKHSEKPVTVWITVDSTVEHGKKYYEVTAADNGPGIPDEKKAQLFERFKGEGGRGGSRGLGLYLVKTIVCDFGGRVKVEDRVRGDSSKGVKFVVLLPAAA